ncbi:hypothetical protein J2046_002910 [Rhizobium petrolearium]|nr:hypothetical protein [Neorhizobium petrolearium]
MRAFCTGGGAAKVVAGIEAGFAIGIVASLLGVAGGELLIPTLMLLFSADIKRASLSLAVSLPTMLIGLARYSQHQFFDHPPQWQVCTVHAGRLDCRRVPRWPAPQDCSELCAPAAPRHHPAALGGQGLAASRNETQRSLCGAYVPDLGQWPLAIKPEPIGGYRLVSLKIKRAVAWNDKF